MKCLGCGAELKKKKMRTFSFKAGNYCINSDSRFVERVEFVERFVEGVEFEFMAEAECYALGLRENWGCGFVNIYEDGELLTSIHGREVEEND